MRSDLTIPELRIHGKLWHLAQNQKIRQTQLTTELLTRGWRRGTEMHSWPTPAFTRCLDDGLSRPEVGYCVAYAETQNAFGMEGLKRAIIHANDDGRGIVGGWFYSGDGKFYFDSVRLFPNLLSAYYAARQNRQIGFYNLSKGLYIPTEQKFRAVLDKMERLDAIQYRYRP